MRLLAALMVLAAAGPAFAQNLTSSPAATASRPGSDGKVWEATCPAPRKAISGSCIVTRARGTPALESTEINEDKWTCVWTQPVEKADVRAVCAAITGN